MHRSQTAKRTGENSKTGEFPGLGIHNGRMYTLADVPIPDFTGGFLKKLSLMGLYPPALTRQYQLCEFCKKICAEKHFKQSRFLARKLESTCGLCEIVSRAFRQFDIQSPCEMRFALRPGYLDVDLKSDGENKQLIRRSLRLYCVGDSEFGFEKHPFGCPVLLKNRSDAYFLLLREWLKDCGSNHPDHSDLFQADATLPTRLLDVRNPGGIRLYHTTDGERGKYIALSHRWGEIQTFSTTRENISEFSKSVAISELPKTFQDAIEVTTRLKIPFLWIDSLCIIQNDAEDWKYESKLMESVFESAYCTIAATSACDSTQGFLDRNPDIRCTRLSTGGADSSMNIYASELDENFEEDVECGILNQRAWVLQERALSRRIIHFTATQTYWECGSVIRSECLLDNFKDPNWFGDSKFPHTASRSTYINFETLFEAVFSKYSELNITKLEDRPVAISGIESRLGTFYNTAIVYGIFIFYVHQSLFWRRGEDTEMLRIDFRESEVPSWSWMAYSGKIQYGSRQDWYRSSGTELSQDLDLDPQNKRVLCSVWQLTPILDFLREHETVCLSGKFVGWARFDQNSLDVVEDLCCVIIAQGESGWKNYTGMVGDVEMPPGTIYYVLLVFPVHNSSLEAQEQEGNKFQRAGVAVVHESCILLNKVRSKPAFVV